MLSRKKESIKRAVDAGDKVGLEQLGRAEGGFLNDKLRRIVWPQLTHASPPKRGFISHKLSPSDLHQVMVDVERAQFFSQVPKGSLKVYRTALSNVIIHVLEMHHGLHYFQGFHEICSVLVLVLGEKMAKSVAESISLFWIRDSMHSSLEATLDQLRLLMPLLHAIDQDLAEFLASIQGLEIHFCISQVLTWLSHTTDVWIVITRFFDLFLCTNPLMPIYVVAATLIMKKKEILNLDSKDFSIVYAALSKFQASRSEMEDLIQIALGIYKKVPPQTLQRISGIHLGKFSAVNTFQDINSLSLSETFNSKLGQQRIIQLSSRSSKSGILGILIIASLVLTLAMNWKRLERQILG